VSPSHSGKGRFHYREAQGGHLAIRLCIKKARSARFQRKRKTGEKMGGIRQEISDVSKVKKRAPAIILEAPAGPPIQ